MIRNKIQHQLNNKKFVFSLHFIEDAFKRGIFEDWKYDKYRELTKEFIRKTGCLVEDFEHGGGNNYKCIFRSKIWGVH